MSFSDVPARIVQIPTVGAKWEYEGKWYGIVRTTTEQDDYGILTNFIVLLPISDKGHDLGIGLKQLRTDTWDLYDLM